MIDRITFGITAFNRPNALRQLVESICQFYPSAHIVVADNGWQFDSFCRARCEYHVLPPDVGLCRCRNFLVDQLTDRRDWLLLLEDDFVFTAETRIDRLADVLAHDDQVDAIAGGVYFGETVDAFPRAHNDRAEIQLLCTPAQVTPAGVRYCRSSWLHNFALFRREFVATHRWDNALKIGEHWSYWWDVRQQYDRAEQVPAAVTADVAIQHDHETDRDAEYLSYRGRATQFNRQSRTERQIQ